jgi:starch synthase
MKAGLYYADRITTVSPSYAGEIQGPEQGMGLDGLLRTRGAVLHGILNGVDPAVWNPSTDPLIAHPYDARKLIGKTRNKAALQRTLGLAEQADAPLFVVISRLTEQKGLHLVLHAVPRLVERGAQFALLGSGDAGMEAAFRDLASCWPAAVAVRLGYDEAFAHQLVAGGDVIMVPSRFEPCGLTQLYGLKYGTLPLVRRVGGLADTVTDTSLENLDDGSATGFVFQDFHEDAMDVAIRRALALYRRKTDWKTVQRHAMARRHDWDVAAQAYAGVYRAALGR